MEAGLAARLVEWTPGLTKGTVIWFLTCGVVLFGGFEAARDPRFLRRKVLDAIELPVFVSFYLDLYPLSYLAELLLQPVLGVLVAAPLVLKRGGADKQVRAVLDVVTASVVLYLLAQTTLELVRDRAAWDGSNLITEALLPVYLSIGALPFVLALGAYATYELVWVRLQLHDDLTPQGRRRALLATLMTHKLDLGSVASAPHYWLREAAATSNLRMARRVMRKHQLEAHVVKRGERERQGRLRAFSGSPGTDDRGRQLDRRGFEETQRALDWIWTCMMGWHRKDSRYPDDLVPNLASNLERFDITSPSGVEVTLGEVGQAWAASRQTETGWWFAIGAAGPPPDRWEFDGPVRPAGLPDPDQGWVQVPSEEPGNRNWH